MTEIDQLKVIKDKENENKKTLQDLKERLEKELKEKTNNCSERYEDIKNQIINNYNKEIEEIKNDENKKLMDVTEKEKARSDVMNLDLSRKEIEDYVYDVLISYIKE
jgi:V/A-type H+-transporting ATPase subunit G/H